MMTNDKHIQPISILFASDLHFGSPTMDQNHMARAFCETILPLVSESDIFFINGDFFDTLVVFDHYGFDPIVDTIFNLFRVCEEHQVVLRVLQGTYTHDRNQLKRWETFYKNLGCSFNYKLHSTIDLEEITVKDHTLKVLFVPDDLPYTSSEDVLDAIHSKLADKGWDSVDYACMHGFFDFTYHKNASQNKVVVYRADQFSFVKKVIDVGHVHQYRVQGNIISNGSFDRGCFGDEDPKGCIKLLDYGDHYTAHFIENKNAAVYDTLVFTKDDTTESIRRTILDHLSTITSWRKISLRCVIESPDHESAIKDWMKSEHPDIRVMVKNKKDVDDAPQVIVDSELFVKVEKRIAPTIKTISTFIKDWIPHDSSLTIDKIDHYLFTP